MYIKNKNTGLVHECHNEDVIHVCKKDTENYEVSETEPKIGGVQAVEKEETVDFEKMKLEELRAFAKKKGITGYASLSRVELLEVLKDVL